MRKTFTIMIICSLFLILPILSNKRIEASEKVENMPTCYQQGDSRWGSVYHGDPNNYGGTIASSACGLLSLVNTVNYLCGTFINPIELADYAYAIGAYNNDQGGGTWRYLFYNRIQNFEEKYGFRVSFYGAERPITDPRIKEHLKKGGAAICLVPGHFISLVGYDESTNSYLVYDSAANLTKRHTYPSATILTEAELSTGNPNMEVSFFCLIEKNIERSTGLDGVVNLCNGKAETSLSISKFDNDPVISGFAFSNYGIKRYYYVVDFDYVNQKQYELSFLLRNDLADKSIDGNYSIQNGFIGNILLEDLSIGTHTINVYAETLVGSVLGIAEINLTITSDLVTKDETITSQSMAIKTLESSFNTTTSYSLGKYNLDNIAALELRLTKPLMKERIYGLFTKNSTNYDGILATSNTVKDSDTILFILEDLKYSGPLYIKDLSNDDLETTVNEVAFLVAGECEIYHKTNEFNHEVLTSFTISNGEILPTYKEEEHLKLVDKVDATCTTDGYKIVRCGICKDILSSDSLHALGHTPNDIYYNDENHYYMCDTCNDYINYTPHEFVMKQNSKKHYLECTECFFKKDIENHVFDQLNHTCECGYVDPTCYHENQKTIEAVQATCTSCGLTEGKICLDCNKTIVKQEIIDKISHEFRDGLCIHCLKIDETYTPSKPKKEGCKKNNQIFFLLMLPVFFLPIKRRNHLS